MTYRTDFYSEIVKLRDHPLMSFGGVRNWPPIWPQSRAGGTITLKGEIGILAHIHHYVGEYNKIFLIVEHEGEAFVGGLLFDDVAFSEQLARLLKSKIGRSIREIGNLDLSYLL